MIPLVCVLLSLLLLALGALLIEAALELDARTGPRSAGRHRR